MEKLRSEKRTASLMFVSVPKFVINDVAESLGTSRGTYGKTSRNQSEKYEQHPVAAEERDDETVIPSKLAAIEDCHTDGQDLFAFQIPNRRRNISKYIPGKKSSLANSQVSQPGNKNSQISTTVNKRHTRKLTSQKLPLRKNIISSCSGTPARLRRKISQKISKAVYNSESESSDPSELSDSEDEYNPSGDSVYSDNTENSEDDDDDARKPVKEFVCNTKMQIEHYGKENYNKQTEINYEINAENYFSTSLETKCVTSNRLLSESKNPRFPQNILHELLNEVNAKHEVSIKNQNLQYCSLFTKWMFALRENFNIIVYGVGSKKNVLQNFQNQLSQYTTVVVNGFFPSLTIREVVNAILQEVVQAHTNPVDLYDCLKLIESKFSADSIEKMFLIVHNIDGPMLQNEKSQDLISRLAALPNIHLLCSVDHVSAAIIWDQSKLSRYNFMWWDVTTYESYKDETRFETSVMIQKSGSLALSSLVNVFQALTSNARNIFLLVANYHLDNKEKQNFCGMKFKDLYRACRDNLLVSSDLALRSQLTEFLEHRLLKLKRTIDGHECLFIPMDVELLNKFIEQQDKL